MIIVHLCIVIIITAHLNYNLCSSGTISTSTSNQYKNQSIYCTECEDCTVVCNEYQSCYNSNIVCPTNHSCNIQCIAEYLQGRTSVCEDANINCVNSAQCDVSCVEEGDHTLYHSYACKDATFNWPNNKQYTLTCGGGASCYGVTIDASYDDKPFTMQCGVTECQNAVINCPDNSTCTVNCEGSNACMNSVINCGADIDSSCYVICVGLRACHGAVINGKGIITKCSGVYACQSVMFPEPPAEDDYALVCDGGSDVCAEAIIKCPSMAACYITCDASFACKSATFTWPSDDIYDRSLECVGVYSCVNVEIPPTKYPTTSPSKAPVIATTDVVTVATMFVSDNVVKEVQSFMDTLQFKLLVLIVTVVLTVMFCVAMICMCRRAMNVKNLIDHQVQHIPGGNEHNAPIEMINIQKKVYDIPKQKSLDVPSIVDDPSIIGAFDVYSNEGRPNGGARLSESSLLYGTMPTHTSKGVLQCDTPLQQQTTTN